MTPQKSQGKYKIYNKETACTQNVYKRGWEIKRKRGRKVLVTVSFVFKIKTTSSQKLQSTVQDTKTIADWETNQDLELLKELNKKDF